MTIPEQAVAETSMSDLVHQLRTVAREKASSANFARASYCSGRAGCNDLRKATDKPSDYLEWKAADEIERLRAQSLMGVEREDIARREEALVAIRKVADNLEAMGVDATTGTIPKLRAAADTLALAPVGGQRREEVARGWIVSNANEDRFRMWGDFGPEWTEERRRAILFARRDDAEAFAREDKDAWKILPQNIVQARSADEDEAYELGKRDGYEDAIQELDVATGGDGEFKGSTFPGATVDVPAMKRRIIDRLSPVLTLPHTGQQQEGWREGLEFIRGILIHLPPNQHLGINAGPALDKIKELLSPASPRAEEE